MTSYVEYVENEPKTVTESYNMNSLTCVILALLGENRLLFDCSCTCVTLGEKPPF